MFFSWTRNYLFGLWRLCTSCGCLSSRVGLGRSGCGASLVSCNFSRAMVCNRGSQNDVSLFSLGLPRAWSHQPNELLRRTWQGDVHGKNRDVLYN